MYWSKNVERKIKMLKREKREKNEQVSKRFINKR